MQGQAGLRKPRSNQCRKGRTAGAKRQIVGNPLSHPRNLKPRQGFMLVFVLLSAAGVAGIFWHFSRVSMNLIESKTLYDAALYSDAVKDFRKPYTRELVGDVRPGGDENPHDTKAHAGSVQVPATLSIELGKRIGQKLQGAETRRYSPYPF